MVESEFTYDSMKSICWTIASNATFSIFLRTAALSCTVVYARQDSDYRVLYLTILYLFNFLFVPLHLVSLLWIMGRRIARRENIAAVVVLYKTDFPVKQILAQTRVSMCLLEGGEAICWWGSAGHSSTWQAQINIQIYRESAVVCNPFAFTQSNVYQM